MELPAFFFLLSLPPPTLSWMYLEVWELLVSPRDGGTWWPAVYGVAQSRTRLKRLSCSSSSEEANFKSQLREHVPFTAEKIQSHSRYYMGARLELICLSYPQETIGKLELPPTGAFFIYHNALGQSPTWPCFICFIITLGRKYYSTCFAMCNSVTEHMPRT